MTLSSRPVLSVLVAALSIHSTQAQTFTDCNPLLNPGACPPNPALGRSVSVDFNSASDSFGSTGTINYGSNGAEFTVAKSGDNPHIDSKWYIMFGRVEFEIKAAPGQGIVSSAVLMSDCLDEIDWEWLGGDNNQVQSNYFRKGQTVTGYNRGAFHDAPGTHDNFHKYTIDWTATQIVWSIDGQTVRVLESTAAENGDYPQTPMQVKVGAWAGGDPGNPQGTIDWAGGLTDYSAGPFTMYLKSLSVTDYSTGSSYSYSGTDGTWESIQSDGGQVNSEGNGRQVSTGEAPAITSTVPNDSSAPLAFDPHDSASVYATRTGWPWDGTATASVLPTGWSIDGNGNARPPSSGAAPYPSSYSVLVSSPVFSSGFGPDTPTTTVATDGSQASTAWTIALSTPSSLGPYSSNAAPTSNDGSASMATPNTASADTEGPPGSSASTASLPSSLSSQTSSGPAMSDLITSTVKTESSRTLATRPSSSSTACSMSTPETSTSSEQRTSVEPSTMPSQTQSETPEAPLANSGTMFVPLKSLTFVVVGSATLLGRIMGC